MRSNSLNIKSTVWGDPLVGPMQPLVYKIFCL